MIRSRSSSGIGGRPGGLGCVHLRATMRLCQASRVRRKTIRCSRNDRGSSLANAASTARSAQSGLGAGTRRRRTDTSCRSTSISMSFAAEDRASSTSQVNIRPANSQVEHANDHERRSCHARQPPPTSRRQPSCGSVKWLIRPYEAVLGYYGPGKARTAAAIGRHRGGGSGNGDVAAEGNATAPTGTAMPPVSGTLRRWAGAAAPSPSRTGSPASRRLRAAASATAESRSGRRRRSSGRSALEAMRGSRDAS